MSGCTRQTSLKLPTEGNITLKVWPETMGGVLTQVEPSKDAAPNENPGQPTGNGGRTCPIVRKVMVWISSAPTVQLTVSPAWIQSSLGRKATTCRPLSALWAPTVACH